LHIDRIEPAPELEADIAEPPRMGKPAFGVERDRDGAGAADHRDHLLEPARPRRRDERFEQARADPRACKPVSDIDAVLAGAGIGGAVAELRGVSVADHHPAPLGNKEGPAARGDVGNLGRPLPAIRPRHIESARAVGDVTGIDLANGLRVTGARRPDGDLRQACSPQSGRAGPSC
jgi:hypothetical protein